MSAESLGTHHVSAMSIGAPVFKWAVAPAFTGSAVLESGATDANPVVVVASPTWSSTYDALGHVATSTDPFGRVTTTVSDMFGQVLSTTQPDPDGSGPLVGSGMQWTYDATGNLLSSTDARIYTTNYTYDAWNRVVKTELPAVAYGTGTARPTSLTTYDVFGDVIRATDAMGRATTYQQDALGRTFKTVSPGPIGGAWSGTMSMTSTTQFDAVGNVVRVTDQLGRQSTTAYDNLNRPIRTTGTDPYTDDFETAPTTTVAYDINGNVARKTDATGDLTRFEYDALNRAILVAMQDTTGWLTSSLTRLKYRSPPGRATMDRHAAF